MCCRATRRPKVRRMASCEWRMGASYGWSEDQLIQGPACLAGSYGVGRRLLSVDKKVSKGRVVWSDVPNSSGVLINSGQYCRGSWSRSYAVLHTVSQNCARFIERSGNPPVVGGASGYRQTGANRSSVGNRRTSGAEVARFDQNVAGKVNVRLNSPFTIRHSRATQ